MVESAQKDSGRKLFYGLFIFPLIIAIGMAVLLCSVVLLTRESETPESLIAAIKTGSPSKRWQKAFGLSNELNQGRGMIRSSGVMNEVIHILENAKEYDEKTRSYMAVALTHFDDPEVVPALQRVLAVEASESVQIFLMWALGVKKGQTAEDTVLLFTQKEKSADVRKMAAYALGVLGSDKSKKALEILLTDKDRDVRWNAALSLARLGSDAGYSELLKMLDRQTLVAEGALDEGKIEEIMVGAVKGIALIGRSDSVRYLKELSTEDKSLKVRQAAIESLKVIQPS